MTQATELIAQQFMNGVANARTWADILYNVKGFGAKGDGATDDTASINAALAAIKVANRGTLFFPPGSYVISSKIQVLQGDSKNIAIKGAGGWCTVIQRSPTYPVGDLFSIDSANGIGASILIEDLRIENSPGFNNTDGYAVHIKNYAFPVYINCVWVQDGNGGFWIDSSAAVMMNNCFYQKSDPAYPSFAGLFVSGHSNTIFVSDSDFFGQIPDNANNLSRGILIRGCDGIQLSNCAMNGKLGLAIEGGYGTNLDDIYVSNCIIDNLSTAGVVLTGTNAPYVYTNIRIANTHINVGGRVGAQECVQIAGDCDFVQILGCNINAGYGAGILVDGSASYTGGSKKSVQILNNDISENNLSNTGNTHGISIANNSTGIKIKNNTIRNRTASGHQKFAIGIGTGCSNLSIQNNDLNGNETGTILFGGYPTASIITDNLGIDDQQGTVATAATVTLPANSIIALTGLVTITTINGGWPGRVVRIFANDGSVILGTAGNILRGITIAQFQMVTLTMVGTNWIIN